MHKACDVRPLLAPAAIRRTVSGPSPNFMEDGRQMDSRRAVRPPCACCCCVKKACVRLLGRPSCSFGTRLDRGGALLPAAAPPAASAAAAAAAALAVWRAARLPGPGA